MRRARKRGPGPSHLLITPDCAGNVVGIDPHKLTVTATIADPRGGVLASEHFRVSGDGHRSHEAWALGFGPVARWGVEGVKRRRDDRRSAQSAAWTERRRRRVPQGCDR